MNVEEAVYGLEPAQSQLATLLREHAAMRKALRQIASEKVNGKQSLAASVAIGTLAKIKY